MSLSAIDQVSIDQTFALLGTPMVATIPGGSPVSLNVVWDTPEIEDVGPGRQLRRALWFKTADLADAPTETEFVGPEPHGGSNKTWVVDETLKIEPGQVQVLVVEKLA